LTVVYDAGCELCRRCRDWLATQPTFVPVRLVPAHDASVAGLPVGEELVVLADTGEAWVGPQAFVMCLWATREYRSWSYRLSGPAFAPLARRFFTAVSQRRGTLSALLSGAECADGSCGAGQTA
jgi:predicted DCC family thiol-disulfide oxidoreductase YuxK